ncbi:MAG: cytochrome c [Cyclobacteriaceae bacterium]|nr:cytochrome c [Cyclobacteriaceae bacterium]
MMKEIMKTYRGRLLATLMLLSLVGTGLYGQDGEAIFKQNCAVCHKLGGGKFIGPDLVGINDRRDNAWLKSFISSSQTLIKGGDAEAIALFNEFNKLAMPDFPLPPADIDAILSYIGSQGSGSGSGAVAAAPAPEPDFTAEDVARGEELFTGQYELENGGPTCLSCHNVSAENVSGGGLLARDLTQAHQRLGGSNAIIGIISSTPFPAMANAYKDKPITETEVLQLTAFLKNAQENLSTEIPVVKSTVEVFWIGSGCGLVALLVIIQLLWGRRKKKAVKSDIFKRQISTN